MDQIKKFCNENPALCSENASNGTIVYRDLTYGMNFTGTELHNLVINQNAMKDLVDRFANYQKANDEKITTYQSTTTESIQNITQSLQYIQKKEESRIFWNSLTRGIIIGIVILLGLLFIIWYFVKKKRLRNMSLNET